MRRSLPWRRDLSVIGGIEPPETHGGALLLKHWLIIWSHYGLDAWEFTRDHPCHLCAYIWLQAGGRSMASVREKIRLVHWLRILYDISLRCFPLDNFDSSVNHLNLSRCQHWLGLRYLGLHLQGRDRVRGCHCLDSIKMLMNFECCVIRIVYMNRNSHLTLRSGAFTLLFYWHLLWSYSSIVRDSRGSLMWHAWWGKHVTLVFIRGFIILQSWYASVWPLELVLESELSVETLSFPDGLLRWEEGSLPTCRHCRWLEGVSWIKLVCLVVRERNLGARVVLWRAGCNSIHLICLLQLLQKGVQTLVNISERDNFHIFIRWT
jgi:hypothetical protein